MKENNYHECKRKKGRFRNFNSKSRVRRTLMDFLFWKVGIYSYDENLIRRPVDFEHPNREQNFDIHKNWISWIGHCTFLINARDYNIITDPIFTHSCSPISFIGPKRTHPPGMPIHALPRIDYVLISHDHYDHLDRQSVLTIKNIYPNALFIVPVGLKKWLKKRGISNAIELNWWQSHEDENVKIHAVPAQHYSGRSLLDGNKRLWAGFVIEHKKLNKKTYFTGDTGYNDIDFKLIGEKFQKIDLSLIPIGTYEPKKFMGPVHISPVESVKIHKDVNSNFSIGMHWKTFRLSDEDLNLPPYELYLNLIKENINPKDFIAIEPGSYVNW